jgi:hypothetical protein
VWKYELLHSSIKKNKKITTLVSRWRRKEIERRGWSFGLKNYVISNKEDDDLMVNMPGFFLL